MTRTAALQWFLRLSALCLLSALVAVFMPYAMMDRIHGELLGLGALPDAPIVGYLARSTSALYALLGAMYWAASMDLPRLLGFLRVFAVGHLVFGLFVLGIGWVEGMPAAWTAAEGPIVIGWSLVLLALAQPERRA